MNLNQLKLFYLTARHSKVKAAAKELAVTQPAVTKGLKAFEDHYELKLLEQCGKKMLMTQEGEALYEIAEQIFELEKAAESCMESFHAERQKKIKIDTSESFGAYHLPPVINRFLKAYPDIHIAVDTMFTGLVEQNTVEMKNDLGIVSGPVADRKLVVHASFDDELVFIVPGYSKLALPGRKIKVQELNTMTVILQDKGSSPRTMLDAFFKKHKIAPPSQLELSSNEAIKHAVSCGCGTALISKEAARCEIEDGSLKVLDMEDCPVKRQFNVVTHKNKHLSTAAQALLEMIRDFSSKKS